MSIRCDLRTISNNNPHAELLADDDTITELMSAVLAVASNGKRERMLTLYERLREARKSLEGK